MSDDPILSGPEGTSDDTEAILSRRKFLIRSALATAGVSAAVSGCSPKPCLSVADPNAPDLPPEPQVCLEVEPDPQPCLEVEPEPGPCLSLPHPDPQPCLKVAPPQPEPCLSVAPQPCLKPPPPDDPQPCLSPPPPPPPPEPQVCLSIIMDE